MEDIRRRAIDKLGQLLNLREPRREIMWALMGDGEGTLEVPGQAGKVYVMLYGDIDQTVRAWNRVVSPAVGRRVDVEVIREPGMPDDYYVVGLSRIGYGGYEDDPPPGWLIHHHETHERRPGGGPDIVNVYKRALTELRADAQATPDMTLLVSAGFYLTTEIKYFVGGNSPAFGAAPGGGQERYDLLYLNATTGVLAIRAGAAVAPGLAERPQPQENEVPVAWVKFTTETAIVDSMITDARITVVTMGAHGLVLIHPLDPADGAHSGTLPADEVSNVPAGGIAATDIQAAIDELDAEKAGTHNILDGTWHPDSVVQGVTRGSLIFGNTDPAWDELVIGAPETYLRSDGIDPAYSLIPAAEVVNIPAGGIAALDVQAALNELDAEKAGIADDESISGDWNFNPGELGLPSGNAFPGAPDEGDIFYRSDLDKLYIYTTDWVEVGAGAGGGAGGIGLAGICWHVDGALAVAAEVGGARLLPQDMTFTKAYIYCKATGTAGSTIADINKNGVTIYTAQGNRPTLAWNDPDKKAVTAAPDVTAGVEGDIMTLDTDQIATGVETLFVILLFEIELFDDAEGDPADLVIPEVDGVSEFTARRDHAHRSKLDMGGAFPGAPAEGDVFYRTDLDKVYIYDGAAWVGLGGGWTLIEDVMLGAPAASIDFQGIPDVYKYLVILFALRSDRADDIDAVNIRFNNDSGGNYDWTRHRGGPITHAVNSGFNDSEIETILACATNSPANAFGSGTIYIYDYASTDKRKSCKISGGQLRIAATNIENVDGWGEWHTYNAAITRVTLSPNVGPNFIAGSRATLYGVS